MASYSRFLLLATLALTATLGHTQTVTLPACAETCTFGAAAIAGCIGSNDTPSCLCNSVTFSEDASDCVIGYCTPGAEQAQAATYFEQYAAANCSGSTFSGTFGFSTTGLSPTGLSPTGSFIMPSTGTAEGTSTTKFTTPTIPSVVSGDPTADSGSSGSGSGVKGFTNGGLGGFVTANDMLKIAAAVVVVGVAAMRC